MYLAFILVNFCLLISPDWSLMIQSIWCNIFKLGLLKCKQNTKTASWLNVGILRPYVTITKVGVEKCLWESIETTRKTLDTGRQDDTTCILFTGSRQSVTYVIKCSDTFTEWMTSEQSSVGESGNVFYIALLMHWLDSIAKYQCQDLPDPSWKIVLYLVEALCRFCFYLLFFIFTWS